MNCDHRSRRATSSSPCPTRSNHRSARSTKHGSATPPWNLLQPSLHHEALVYKAQVSILFIGTFSSRASSSRSPFNRFRSQQEQFGAGFTHYNQVLTLFILHRFAPSINSSLFIWETDNNSSDVGSTERPIDTIFKFHKAIRKDLDYLDIESESFPMVMKQLFGNLVKDSGFCGVYIELIVMLEDDIVFPALESKEALHNVDHSYTPDHKRGGKITVWKAFHCGRTR
ncbi:hypothetical protein ACSQ67_011544 [Phaseolus vulgaris]